MNDFKWHFPESETECFQLFNDGFRPHAGGTFLIKTRLNLKGLFDLNRIEEYKIMKSFEKHAVLGSAVSYAEASAFLKTLEPDNFISKALSSAASTSLRNRITIGGSIVASPKWSDITGPLAAAGASLSFTGKSQDIKFSEYVADNKHKKNSLISKVKIPLEAMRGNYYRFTLTGVDYPFFTISSAEIKKDNYRCVITGCKNGLQIFTGKFDNIAQKAEKELSFNNERGMTGQYIKKRAIIELKRVLSFGGANDE